MSRRWPDTILFRQPGLDVRSSDLGREIAKEQFIYVGELDVLELERGS